MYPDPAAAVLSPFCCHKSHRNTSATRDFQTSLRVTGELYRTFSSYHSVFEAPPPPPPSGSPVSWLDRILLRWYPPTNGIAESEVDEQRGRPAKKKRQMEHIINGTSLNHDNDKNLDVAARKEKGDRGAKKLVHDGSTTEGDRNIHGILEDTKYAGENSSSSDEQITTNSSSSSSSVILVRRRLPKGVVNYSNRHAKRFRNAIAPTKDVPCDLCDNVVHSNVFVPAEIYSSGSTGIVCQNCKNHPSSSMMWAVQKLPPHFHFRCCPAHTIYNPARNPVCRCYSCSGWYHCGCLEILDDAVVQRITAISCRWVCPDCAEVRNLRHLRDSVAPVENHLPL